MHACSHPIYPPPTTTSLDTTTHSRSRSSNQGHRSSCVPNSSVQAPSSVSQVRAHACGQEGPHLLGKSFRLMTSSLVMACSRAPSMGGRTAAPPVAMRMFLACAQVP